MGDAGHLHIVSAVRNRPLGVLPPVPGVFTPDRERAGTPADRGRERPGQLPLPLRARCHGDPGEPGLADRRRAVAVPHRLARRTQRRPEQDGAAHPQPHVRARRRDQRVRGVVESPADLRRHPCGGRALDDVLLDLVAEARRRDVRRAARQRAGASREAVPAHRVGGPGHLALSGVHRESAAGEDRCETVYGAEEMGSAVLRRPRLPPGDPASV